MVLPTRTKQKRKHVSPCPTRESNPEPLAPQSDGLPLATQTGKHIDCSQTF